MYGSGIADNPTEAYGGRLEYIDALFICTSAMTSTASSPCDIDDSGNVVFVSTSVVVLRRHFFRKKLSDVMEHSKAARKVKNDIDEEQAEQSSHPTSKGSTNPKLNSEAPTRNVSSPAGDSDPLVDDKNANGRLHSLQEEERRELGGVEYRALSLLMLLLPIYLIGWLTLGTLFLVPYSYRPYVKNIITTTQTGYTAPGWWSFFMVMSSFGNLFQSTYYILIMVGLLNLAGNTQFPVLLRLSVLVDLKVSSDQFGSTSHSIFSTESSTKVLHL
ncbi:hypothetical protein G7Y79_00110g101620 [Physcia stellaris]|nr:hypothetical protein G7Y79_00110g101620 [Physcia stellaris]